MPFSASAFRLVISSPGDIDQADLDALRDAVYRWNAVYGVQFGAVVVPVHWTKHSAAEYGVRPQASINDQLIDSADILIAIFWNRLGTETGEAQSGTVEEIERAHERDAYVAVLRCRRDVSPETIDPEQLASVQSYMGDIEQRALLLDYSDTSELRERVDAILNRSVTHLDATAASVAQQPSMEGAEIWPRVERSESTRVDAKGVPRSQTRWQLVLSNTGSESAKDVRFALENESSVDGQLPLDAEDQPPLEVLPPGGEAPYNLIMFMGVAEQARCRVTWTDARGEQENVATLRFF
jgi:hypothetical protein